MTIFNPPIDPPNLGSVNYWTFALVEERLVEAMRLWWRAPGGGRWPFAADAPWELMVRETNKGDYSDPDATPRPLPLSMAEIAERDETSEWLLIVPDRDRQLVVLTILAKAKGRRIRWAEIRARMNAESSPRGLGMRYSRALTAIARRLNGGAKH